LATRTDNPSDASIAETATRLMDDGRAYLRAEINLYKQIARYRAQRAKSGMILVVAGGVLALAGFIAFLVGIVMALATLVGPLAAALIVLVVTGGAGFLLIRRGAKGLSALSGDEEERAALADGENFL